jgi:hypothetical protein
VVVCIFISDCVVLCSGGSVPVFQTV